MEQDNSVDIVQVFSLIKKRYKAILGIMLAVTSVVFVNTILSPKKYKADATIVTMASSGKGAGFYGLASQLGGLMDFPGMGGGGDTAKMMAILKSRSLAERIVLSANVLPDLFKKQDPANPPALQSAAYALLSHMRFEPVDGPSIIISGIFDNPEVAAKVVNAYTDGLQKYINDNSLTVAKRHRIFVEGQMKQKLQEMLEAGKEIASYYKDGGRVSQSKAQVDVPIGTTPKHMVLSKTGEFEPVVSASTEELAGEIKTLQKEIDETGTVKDVPQQVYLTYLTRRYALLGSIYELLVTQYQTARIDEAKSDLAFQVVDPAIVPMGPFGSNWRLNTMLALVVSLFMGIFYAFLREHLEKRKLSRLPAARPAEYSHLDPILRQRDSNDSLHAMG